MSKDILIIDDEQDIRVLLSGVLSDEGYTTTVAQNSKEALKSIAKKPPNLVVLDIWLQGSELDGLEILEEIVEQHPGLPVIMISGHGNIETAVQAIKKGASNFIEKPIKLDHLLFVVEKTLENSRLKRENETLKKFLKEEIEFISFSQNSIKVNNLIKKVAPTQSRVLITGPAGSGKEVTARLIHQGSSRTNDPFIILNCATMSQEVIETKLFGVEPKNPEHIHKTLSEGPRQVGYLEKARGGTIYLDEITDMPLETQGKFVKILQDKTFYRINGQTEVEVDIRFIASSSKDLPSLVKKGKFREDLYYRLNVVPITLPKLSERREDIIPFAEYFIKKIHHLSSQPIRKLTSEAEAILQAYDWPGNIRQLKNTIEWIYIMHPNLPENLISSNHLPPDITRLRTFSGDDQKTLSDLMSLELKLAREEFEKQYLSNQLKRFQGNISKTAHFIGMERSALHRKLKSLGLHSDHQKETNNPLEKAS